MQAATVYVHLIYNMCTLSYQQTKCSHTVALQSKHENLSTFASFFLVTIYKSNLFSPTPKPHLITQTH